MTNLELRPLSLGELLDRVIKLYKNHFWLFVGIMVIPSLILLPANLLFLGSTPFWAQSRGGQPNVPSPGFLVGFFVLMIAFWLVNAIALGATTHAVSEVYLGRASTVRGAYRKVGRRFWRLMTLILSVSARLLGLIVLLGVALGLLLPSTKALGGAGVAVAVLIAFLAFVTTFVLFVFLMLRYAVCIPAMLIEDVKAGASINRSIELTKGRRGQIFLAVLLTVVLSYVALLIFQGPFLVVSGVLGAKGDTATAFWLATLGTTAGALGGAVSSPLLMIVLVLFYYDLRVRKEAFDLELLMSSLGPSEAPGTAPVPSA